MLRINPVLRASYRLLSRSRAGFCITNGYLNPARHITMNHNPHNVYIDAYDIGQYPEVVEIMSQPPRTYEPVVAKTLVEVINKKYVTFGRDVAGSQAHRGTPLPEHPQRLQRVHRASLQGQEGTLRCCAA
jgi:hypothetical protein